MPAKRAAARRRHGSQGAAAPFGSGWVILAAIVSLAVAGCQTTVAGQQESGQAARHAADLDAVLLTTSEVDAAMAATGMAADTTQSTLVDDSAYTTPSACLAVSSMGQDHVYAGTGWTAARMKSVHEPGDDYAHLAHQAVVEFPTSAAADAFLTASAQKGWPACAPGHYTYAPGAGDDATGWDVGPATEKDHVLTVTITESDSDSWACQRDSNLHTREPKSRRLPVTTEHQCPRVELNHRTRASEARDRIRRRGPRTAGGTRTRILAD